MKVLSPEEPPPMLSPMSISATGNLSLAMACVTAAAASGRLRTILSRVAHNMSATRWASLAANTGSLSVTTTTLGPMARTSAY